jgi:hypothetical protein
MADLMELDNNSGNFVEYDNNSGNFVEYDNNKFGSNLDEVYLMMDSAADKIELERELTDLFFKYTGWKHFREDDATNHELKYMGIYGIGVSWEKTAESDDEFGKRYKEYLKEKKELEHRFYNKWNVS